MGCKLFDCQHGKDRNASLKRKHQRQRDEVSKYIRNPGAMIPPNTVNYYISYFDPNYQGVMQIKLGYVVLSVCFSGWRFTGPMVIPAISEFIQIVNIGAHWVCISTLGCQGGIVRIFDSLYSKPSSVAIDHACRILHHPQNTVTFLNKRVQKQVGSSDCALFALAFATDLCYGLYPTARRRCSNTMLPVQSLGRQSLFQKLINEHHFIWAATVSQYQSFAFAGSQKIGKSMWNVFRAMAFTILTVSQYQNGPSSHGYNGTVKNAEIPWQRWDQRTFQQDLGHLAGFRAFKADHSGDDERQISQIYLI